MKLIVIITMLASSMMTLCKNTEPVRVSTPGELVKAINDGRDIIITCDSMDLTGVILPPLKSEIQGNGCKFICSKLPESGELFMFTLNGGSIDSCTIIGPNSSVIADGGYFGGIKSMTGKISLVNFIGCDKFGVYVLGDRKTLTDSTYIDRCSFNGINRNGFGYGIWNQYGTAKVTGSSFDHCRHFIDCSSEAWVYDISGCTFGPSHWNYAIHNHEYPDGSGKSGTKMTFRNNYVFGKTTPICIYRTSETSLFEFNNFEATSDMMGTIEGKPIITDGIFKSNNTGGSGMMPAPSVSGNDIIQTGQTPVWNSTDYPQTKWESAKPKAISIPEVKTYEVYGTKASVKSLTAYKTLVVRDTGIYLGFQIKTAGCTVEVLRNNTVIDKITTSKWTKYLYRGNGLSLRISGVGEVYIDDWHRQNMAETFETSSKVKLKYNGTQGVKASRFVGEAASGIWSLRITLTQKGSIGVE